MIKLISTTAQSGLLGGPLKLLPKYQQKTKNRKKHWIRLFYLDRDPVQNARWLSDRHVKTQITTTGTLLSGIYTFRSGLRERSPRNVEVEYYTQLFEWANTSQKHFDWLVSYSWEVCNQHVERFGTVHPDEAEVKWYFGKFNPNMFLDDTELKRFGPMSEPPQQVKAPLDVFPDRVLQERLWYAAQFDLTWAKATMRPEWLDNARMILEELGIKKLRRSTKHKES